MTAESVSGGTGSVTQETILISYSAMQYAYQPLGPTGSTAAVIATNWDITTRASDYAPATILPSAGMPGIATAERSTSPRTAKSNKRINVSAQITQLLAAKTTMPLSTIETVLDGNLTEFLTIPGIKGTSTLAGHTNSTKIEDFTVESVNWFGKATPTPFTYVKVSDLNGPPIWELIARSLPYSGSPGELDLVDTTTATPQTEAYFQFGTLFPESYAVEGALGQPTQELHSMFYAQIKFCVIPFDASGKAGTPVCSGWDYLTNHAL